MSGWEYAPALESAGAAGLAESYGIFVGGEFGGGGGGPLHPLNPATEAPLAEVATADRSDVDSAVAAARASLRSVWGALPGAERAKYLFRLSRLVQERARELAAVETLDGGKPVQDSSGVQVPAAAAHLFHHAGWADKLDHAGFGADPRPLGVVAVVLSADHPLRRLASVVAPALAAGNAVVLKPSATTPLAALVFADLCRQAGLPAGAVNVLPGTGEVGAQLVAHGDVDAVAFAGSTGTGREVQKAAAGKRLAMELDGTGAHVVYDDAPLDQAVDGVVAGFSGSGGENCSRVLVQEPIAAEFLAKLRDRVRALRVGDPMDKNTDVGPLCSAERLARARELADSAQRAGATRWDHPGELPERGFFAAPAVFPDAQQAMRLAREPIPGPLLPVLTFRTPEEAVAKANNTPYGHTAAVWADKGSRALWTARQLQAGVVQVNTTHRSDPTAPPEPRQQSGFGRIAGLEAYLDV